MSIKNNIGLIRSFLKTRLNRNKFFPLAVSWSLTRRCNYRCKYCNEWNYPCDELTTNQIFSIMDELKKIGTKIIGFDGGEPLLREDIGNIIDYTKRQGFIVTINTNGSLVEKKIKEIKKANLINISFDGPEKVHNFLRGRGSYVNVMNAVEILKKNNVPTKLNCTLLKYNLPHIDFIAEKAAQLKVKVRFEPISDAHLRNEEDVLNSLSPIVSDYKEAIQKLMESKKTNKYIMHSNASLKYLQNWPYPKKIDCFVGKFMCRIEPNGDLYPCTMMRKVVPKNCLTLGFRKAFEALEKIDCGRCWCLGTLEFNCLLSANLRTILDTVYFLKR